MGKGNVRVNGEYETLFYVDYDDLEVYWNPETDDYRMRREIPFEEIEQWQYDEEYSQENYANFCYLLTEGLRHRIKSFQLPTESEQREERDGRLLLSNKLFRIVLVDNEYSVAVELLQNENNSYCIENFQRRHFETYKKALQDCLFEQFDTLRIFTGIWTHGTITKKGIGLDYIA